MVILLPSYKRTAILPVVIESILQCDTQGIEERILILIVNNYFDNREIVNCIVNKFDFNQQFCCEVIHRKQTLPAVESWFTAIFENALENEVVVLLGDDDLMLPWGLRNRYLVITAQEADMLVSDFYQRIYFSDDGKRYALLPNEPISFHDDAIVSTWEFLPSSHPRASFVSNHCYRNTRALREAFEISISWAKTQNWVPYSFSTGSLPLYMSFAMHQCGGKLIALSEKSVLRGALISEAVSQEYSDGCSTAFYCLLLFQMCVSVKLHEDQEIIDQYKDLYLQCVKSNIAILIANRPVTWSILIKTIKQSKLRIVDIVNLKLFAKSIAVFLLRLVPGVRGYRVTREFRRNSDLDPVYLLNSLKANYSPVND